MALGFASRIGWLATAVVFNGLTVYGLTDYLIDKSMSGFNTSQTNLSNQMTALQGSLENVRTTTDTQAAESRGDLAREIGNLASIIRDLNTDLGQRLGETSTQLASLNATLSGMDRRLTETIARQEKVEGILMKQRVMFGPPTMSLDGIGVYADSWKKAGFDISPIVRIDEAKALSDWSELSGFIK